MTNLQRVGGKVEVAKDRYFNANTWMKGMTEKAKLDAFCEWCDRECEVAYYEIYFDDNHKDVFKYRNLSSVFYILGEITGNRERFECSNVYDNIRSRLNTHTSYTHIWTDSFLDDHSITIRVVYK